MELQAGWDEKQLGWAIAQAPVAIALFDRQLRYRLGSERWLECHDLAIDEPPTDRLYTELFPDAPEHWVSRYYKCIERTLATSDSGYLTLPSGHAIWMQWQATPWVDRNRQVCGLILHAERIDENIEVNLSWARALHFSPDLYSVLRLDGRVKHVNAAWKQVLGYNPTDICGRSFYELIHPDDLPHSEDALQQLVQGQRLTDLENRCRHCDGSYRWLQWTAMPEFDRGEIYAVARDVTERHEANDALARSETQLREQTQTLERALSELQSTQMQLVQTEKLSHLGEMLAGVAHEINNPVNFIYGNLVHAREYTRDLLELVEQYRAEHTSPSPDLEAALEDSDLDFIAEDLPQLLESMAVGADRIKEIVASLRNFSRIDATASETNLHECIDSTLTILHNRLKGNSDRPETQIERNYHDALPAVRGYAGPLSQVFMNIICNALDAFEERDVDRAYGEIKDSPNRIAIATSTVGDRVTIEISDNGPGMSEVTRSQLFEPFFTTKPVGKGTGLGLSICRQIVEDKHYGKLVCDAAAGGGTRFAIELPIAPPPEAS